MPRALALLMMGVALATTTSSSSTSTSTATTVAVNGYDTLAGSCVDEAMQTVKNFYSLSQTFETCHAACTSRPCCDAFHYRCSPGLSSHFCQLYGLTEADKPDGWGINHGAQTQVFGGSGVGTNTCYVKSQPTSAACTTTTTSSSTVAVYYNLVVRTGANPTLAVTQAAGPGVSVVAPSPQAGSSGWNHWYTVAIAGGTLSVVAGVVWYRRDTIAIRCKDAAKFMNVGNSEPDGVVQEMNLL